MLTLALLIILSGFNGTAQLSVVGDNYSQIFNVTNGSVIELPDGSYELRLFALNKTFVKFVKIPDDKVVEFNLRFTNSPENLSVVYHTFIYASNGVRVDEAILISNVGSENFEGDLAVPLPEFDNLRIKKSALSFRNAFLNDSNLIFDDLLVPANSSGEIVIEYELKGWKFHRKANGSFVVLSSLRVSKYSGLKYQGDTLTYSVFRGNDSYYGIELMRSSLDFPWYAAIFPATIFAALSLRRGRWKV